MTPSVLVKMHSYCITRYYPRGKIKGCDFDELKSDLAPRMELLTGYKEGALME
jgi:hypothetical protein